MITTIVQTALAVSCLVGCGSVGDLTDYIDHRTKTPVPGYVGDGLPEVESGIDSSLQQYIDLYLKYRPTGRVAPRKLRAFRWTSQATVNKACDMPADSDRVIGCCVSSSAGFGTIVLSQDWADRDRGRELHSERVRNLAVHELGHCFDGMQHLEAPAVGIMQPNVQYDGFVSDFIYRIVEMFRSPAP